MRYRPTPLKVTDDFLSPDPECHPTFDDWFDSVDPERVAERARAEGRPAVRALYWFTQGSETASQAGMFPKAPTCFFVHSTLFCQKQPQIKFADFRCF